MCRGGSEPLQQQWITAPKHQDSSLPTGPKGSMGRRGEKVSCGERLLERRVRSKLGRKGWREQDSGSDGGLRSEQEAERKVLEVM